MFGKSAFYVKGPDGSFSSFLLKPDAAAYAKTVGGTVVSFDQAWGAFQS